MRLNVNTGVFSGKPGTFQPARGGVNVVGARQNPRVDYGRGTLSALLLVGLSSPSGATFTIEDIVAAGRDTRVDQIGDPGASFLTQKGLYLHRVTGKVVEEDSVRVIIVHLEGLTGETAPQFKDHIQALAEVLRADFDQDSIVVEIQNRGVTEEVYGAERP